MLNVTMHALLGLYYDLLYLSCITYEMFMFILYEYGLQMKRKKCKFTFGGLNVVLSVDGGMGHYSYIAQSIAWGYLR